ncbi:MAG: DMT family transporter [Candidatus Hodarchaeales archaeon]
MRTKCSPMLIAIFVALFGTIILNIGFILQKSEAAQLPPFISKNISVTAKQILKCRRWMVGTLLTTCGWLFFLIAITLAPLTVIAPLSNAGVIILATIAYFYLRESLRMYEWIGFIAILVGVTFIPIYAIPITNNEIELNTFLLLGLTSVCLVGLLILKISQKILFPLKNGSILGIASGVTAGLGSAYTKLLGSLTEDVIPLVGALIFVAIFQILSFLTLQTAFQQERATVVVPLFNSFATLIPLVYGVSIFAEVIPIGQLVGIILIVLGASALFQFSGEEFSSKFQDDH